MLKIEQKKAAEKEKNMKKKHLSKALAENGNNLAVFSFRVRNREIFLQDIRHKLSPITKRYLFVCISVTLAGNHVFEEEEIASFE